MLRKAINKFVIFFMLLICFVLLSFQYTNFNNNVNVHALNMEYKITNIRGNNDLDRQIFAISIIKENIKQKKSKLNYQNNNLKILKPRIKDIISDSKTKFSTFCSTFENYQAYQKIKNTVTTDFEKDINKAIDNASAQTTINKYEYQIAQATVDEIVSIKDGSLDSDDIVSLNSIVEIAKAKSDTALSDKANKKIDSDANVKLGNYESNSKNNNMLYIIIGVACGALLLALIVTLILIIIKKKRASAPRGFGI